MLIPKEYAGISWHVDGNTADMPATCFRVFDMRTNKFRDFEHGGRSGWMSHGAAFTDWREGITYDTLLTDCLQIAFEYNHVNTKVMLLELGKIKELNIIRLLCYRMFADVFPDRTFDEFVKGYYESRS